MLKVKKSSSRLSSLCQKKCSGKKMLQGVWLQGALFRKLLPVTDLSGAQFRSTDKLLNLNSQFR